MGGVSCTPRVLLRLTLLLFWGCIQTITAARPNIVTIVLDDADRRLVVDNLKFLPNINRYLAQGGTELRNYFINNAICCPSRVTMLTGKCSHNSGTALIGKYMNGYLNRTVPEGWDEWLAFGGAIGFYNWTAIDKTAAGDAVTRKFGSAPGEYSTDVFTDRAVSFLNRSLPSGNANTPAKPVFLYLNPYAPHLPSEPAPRHDNKLKGLGLKVPRTSAYNARVQGGVTGLSYYPALLPDTLRFYDLLYQKRVESLLAVDDMLGSVVASLRTAGVLKNTYLILTADNGFHAGERRMVAAKSGPFDEDILVPFFIAGPGVAANLSLPHVAGNVDFAPTILGLAGAAPPASVGPLDGVSLVRLLTNRTYAQAQATDSLHSAILIEKLFNQLHPDWVGPEVRAPPGYDPFKLYRQNLTTNWTGSFATLKLQVANRTVNKGAWRSPGTRHLAQLDSQDKWYARGDGVGSKALFYWKDYGVTTLDIWNHQVGFFFPSTFYGLRLVNKKWGSLLYLEHNDGYGAELFNVTADPGQISNVIGRAPAALLKWLKQVLRDLSVCRGAGCNKQYPVP